MRWTEKQGFAVELTGNMEAYPSERSSQPVTASGIVITVTVIAEDRDIARGVARAHAVEHGLKEITSCMVVKGPFAILEARI